MPWKSFLQDVNGFPTWKSFIWGEQPDFYVKSRSCSKCRNRFRKGQRVYRKLSGRRKRTVMLYCQTCFERLWT